MAAMSRCASEPSEPRPRLRSCHAHPAPALIIFDVIETLSDMSPLQQRFEEVGLDAHEATTWFATLLRDGFALTVTGAKPSLASPARGSLEVSLAGHVPEQTLEHAVLHIIESLSGLGVHGDVVDGVTALAEQSRRLATLSNGGTAVAEALFAAAGICDHFDQLRTVEDAPRWKPDQEAYHYALRSCELDEPGEAMLVAVHPWDIEGARSAGLSTAWINRSGVRYPPYFGAPDLQASSVLDLAQQLASGPA